MVRLSMPDREIRTDTIYVFCKTKLYKNLFSDNFFLFVKAKTKKRRHIPPDCETCRRNACTKVCVILFHVCGPTTNIFLPEWFRILNATHS